MLSPGGQALFRSGGSVTRLTPAGSPDTTFGTVDLLPVVGPPPGGLFDLVANHSGYSVAWKIGGIGCSTQPLGVGTLDAGGRWVGGTTTVAGTQFRPLARTDDSSVYVTSYERTPSTDGLCRNTLDAVRITRLRP